MNQQLRDIPRIHIVGRKNSGKTTLVCDLVSEFTLRGLHVATIKHTHHHHELDTPGKDSHKHRGAGAAGVGILSPQMTAAFVPVDRAENESDRYHRFHVLFNDCDVILVEGDLQTSAPRLEVWRNATGEPPYASADEGIFAVVSDDHPPVICDVILRKNVGRIAEFILRQFIDPV